MACRHADRLRAVRPRGRRARSRGGLDAPRRAASTRVDSGTQRAPAQRCRPGSPGGSRGSPLIWQRAKSRRGRTCGNGSRAWRRSPHASTARPTRLAGRFAGSRGWDRRITIGQRGGQTRVSPGSLPRAPFRKGAGRAPTCRPSRLRRAASGGQGAERAFWGGRTVRMLRRRTPPNASIRHSRRPPLRRGTAGSADRPWRRAGGRRPEDRTRLRSLRSRPPEAAWPSTNRPVLAIRAETRRPRDRRGDGFGHSSRWHTNSGGTPEIVRGRPRRA